jgi:hypothetical protein
MSSTVAFKLGNNLALMQEMPFAVADMALNVGEVIEKHRSLHPL